MHINEFEKIYKNINFDEGIQGKEEYFNSAVLVLLVPLDGEYHLLFQKRSAYVKQPGEICFPGGKIEPTDKTIEDAAIREVEEEMGLHKDNIHVIGKLKTIVAPMGIIVHPFVAIAELTLNELMLNKKEVEEVFLVPMSYFLHTPPKKYCAKVEVQPSFIDKTTGEEVVLLPSEKLDLPKRYQKPWGNLNYGVYVYDTQWGKIWGITARMVKEFVDKIKDTAIENL